MPTSLAPSRKACRSPTRARPNAPRPRKTSRRWKPNCATRWPQPRRGATASVTPPAPPCPRAEPGHAGKGVQGMDCRRGPCRARGLRRARTAPRRAPGPAPAGRRTRARPRPSYESRALASYYERIERNLLSRGLLRTDGGGPDTPYTDTDLIRNFERIVFFDEYAPGGGYRPSSGRAGGLRKWQGPVRMGIEFGASVPRDQQVTDRNSITAYANRLAQAARHPISAGARTPNFHVLVMSEDDRAQGLARVRQMVPDIDPATMGIFRSMPRSIHC